jgi:dimethylamine corrinoid protein
MAQQLADAFVALDRDRCLTLVRERIDAGMPITEIIGESRVGMGRIGDKYAAGEFLSELVMAGHIFGECMKLLEPLIEGHAHSELGTIVVGTVAGDIHDLGKNIFCSLLRAEGFDVVDLGVDVPPERFVEAVREHEARIVGLSCLLTVAFDAMRRTVQAFEAAGMRGSVTILIGGSIASDRVCDEVGADGFATDAVAGVRECVRIVGSLNGSDEEESS